MTYCPECGAETEPEWAHCLECGTKLPERGELAAEVDPAAGSTAPSSTERPGTADTTATTAPDTAADSDSGYATGRKGLLAGAGLISVGAFLPWFKVTWLGTTVSKRGIEADGVFTLAAAALIALIAVIYWSLGTQVFGLLGGLGVTMLGALYLVDPFTGVSTNGTTEAAQQAVVPEIGLYLTLFGGAIATLASVYAITHNEGSSGGAATAAPAPEPTATTDERIDDHDATRDAGAGAGSESKPPSRSEATAGLAVADLPSEEQAAADAILSRLEGDHAVTKRDLKVNVYPDYQAGYDSADLWWSEFARPLLDAHDDVEALDGSGIRWRLADGARAD